METMGIAAILGILAPFATGVITRAHWPGQWKRWAFLAVALVFGGLAWVVTRFPAAGTVILAEVSTVIAAGQLAYTALKPTGLWDQWEQLTSPAPPGGASRAD